MKDPRKRVALRTLIVVITLALALSLLGTSTAQRKAGSRAKKAQPEKADCGNTDIDGPTSLTKLVAGNRAWQGSMMRRDWGLERRTTAMCQKPYAVVIACMDSRVPPELIFDRGLGEIFVIRVAGPVLDNDQLASLEYAVDKRKVKLVVVLGHTNCGAVQGAVAGVGGTYLPELLVKLGPAVTYVKNRYHAGQPISPLDWTTMNKVSSANAREVFQKIPDFGQQGVIKTWGLYDTASGAVAFEPKEPWLP
jgi:carbonic anhydrase